MSAKIGAIMLDKNTLTDREQLILHAIVHHYIVTAEPVGSRAIVKRFKLDISPATVRNVMADLEETGYLQQLHTSSGRVPTDKGYRYYVNYLMRVQELTYAERSRIEVDLERKLSDADEVLQRTSHLLALISHQAGIVEAPSPELAQIRTIELMPIGTKRAALLVADNYGRVRTTVLAHDELYTSADAQKLNRFLNDRLRGTPVSQIGRTVEEKLNENTESQRDLAELAFRLLRINPPGRSSQLFLEGATQLFEQPEFQDVNKAREVFGLLEEDSRVVELLRAGITDVQDRSSRVVIGSESLDYGMQSISVVSAPYQIDEKIVGMVGVLGPRRMPYSRLTGIVEYTASMLGKILTRLANK